VVVYVRKTEKMKTIQLYVSESLHAMLLKMFGVGKMSGNVERILRAHLSNVENEKTLRLRELNAELRRFNADFSTGGELYFPEEHLGHMGQMGQDTEESKENGKSTTKTGDNDVNGFGILIKTSSKPLRFQGL
jgi:hypothetical protein